MSMPRILFPALGACAAFLLTACGSPALARTRPCRRNRPEPRRRGGQSHHRRGAAEPGAERDPELGPAAGGPEVGHDGRHRHRSEGRPHLGLRALRRGHGRRRSRRLRQQPGRSGLQVRPQHRRGARQHRQGRHGDAARHPRRQGRQRVDCRLRRQQGRHQGPSGPQVQPEGREAAEPRHRRQAGQRRRPVQPAERRRRRARRQHLRGRRTRRAGHDHRRRDRRGPQARRHRPHQQVLARRQVHQVVGEDRRAPRRVPHAARAGVRRARAACGWPIAATTASRSSIRTATYLESRYMLRPHQRVLHQGRHCSTRSTRSRAR